MCVEDLLEGGFSNNGVITHIPLLNMKYNMIPIWTKSSIWHSLVNTLQFRHSGEIEWERGNQVKTERYLAATPSVYTIYHKKLHIFIFDDFLLNQTCLKCVSYIWATHIESIWAEYLFCKVFSLLWLYKYWLIFNSWISFLYKLSRLNLQSCQLISVLDLI